MYHIKEKDNISIMTFINLSRDDAREIIKKLEAKEISRVLIDMENTYRLNSNFLTCFMAICNKMKEMDIKYGVCNIGENNKMILVSVGVYKLLPIFDDIQHAVNDWNQSKESLNAIP